MGFPQGLGWKNGFGSVYEVRSPEVTEPDGRDPVMAEGTCPDVETLAGYVDGMLADADRQAVERHLVGCADCRDVVVDTAAFVSDERARAAEAAEKRGAQERGVVTVNPQSQAHGAP